MVQEKIDISVITPFYNGNVFMKQLFCCIRNNALVAPKLGIELILVNDSPECQIHYSNEWIEGFSLRIISNPVNAGIQQSRINGLRMARGTFIIFLDQDDLLSDTALLSQYTLAQNADIVVSNGYNENRDKAMPIYHSTAHQKQVMRSRFYLSVGCMIVSPGQCMIRRRIIPRLWAETCITHNGADDFFLWMILLCKDIRWAINPDTLYTHINTGSNLSIDFERMLQSSTDVLYLLKQHGMLTSAQIDVAQRRFAMRRFYEGQEKWRKLVACIRYPDLAWELLIYTCLKKFYP